MAVSVIKKPTFYTKTLMITASTQKNFLESALDTLATEAANSKIACEVIWDGQDVYFFSGLGLSNGSVRAVATTSNSGFILFRSSSIKQIYKITATPLT